MIFLGFSGLPLPVTRGDNFRGVVEPGHARGRRSENFCCSAQKQLDPNAAPPISAPMLQSSKTVSASRGSGTDRHGQEIGRRAATASKEREMPSKAKRSDERREGGE